MRSVRSHRVVRAKFTPATHMAETLESRVLLSTGGGYTGAGILGSYYVGTNLDNGGTVQPSFTRSDDRVDFNFGTTSAPGGSNSPGFNAIGTTNWSARWVGSVIRNSPRPTPSQPPVPRV